jgi:hypothetical protein
MGREDGDVPLDRKLTLSTMVKTARTKEVHSSDTKLICVESVSENIWLPRSIAASPVRFLS